MLPPIPEDWAKSVEKSILTNLHNAVGAIAETGTKRNTVTCWCDAYKFPHRIGGGKCERLTPTEKPIKFWCIICKEFRTGDAVGGYDIGGWMCAHHEG